MKTQYLLLLLTVHLGLSGCAVFDAVSGSDSFGCAGMPEGVQCLSAREVYQATETTDTVRGGGQRQEKTPVEPSGASPAGERIQGPAPALRVSNPLPIRTQSQVMRVWIAPWEDAHGDLHAPGYVYTEVVPRRWSLGEPATATATQRIAPLQVQHRSEGTATPRPSRPAPAEPARPSAPPSTPRPEAAAGA